MQIPEIKLLLNLYCSRIKIDNAVSENFYHMKRYSARVSRAVF